MSVGGIEEVEVEGWSIGGETEGGMFVGREETTDERKLRYAGLCGCLKLRRLYLAIISLQ